MSNRPREEFRWTCPARLLSRTTLVIASRELDLRFLKVLACGDLQDGRVVRDRAEITDEVREDLRKFKALLKKL
jgi:hypothetical protein